MLPVVVSVLVGVWPADRSQTVAASMELVRVGCSICTTPFIEGLTALCARPGRGVYMKPTFGHLWEPDTAMAVAAATDEVARCQSGNLI